MESLVYIHLACAYDANGTTNTPATPTEAQVSHRLNLKQVYKKVWIHLLSLVLAATSLGVTNQAMAALRQGSKGPEVVQLQQQLKQLGYFNRRATGNFGPLTKAAVFRFQENEGINPNGLVDDETQAALENKIGGTQSSTPKENLTSRPKLKRGDRSEGVKSLQQFLTNVGAYDGEINGVFDSPTSNAVKQFQRSSGLVVDGIVGQKTWAALIEGNTSSANNEPFSSSAFNEKSFTSGGSAGESSGQRIGTPVLRQGDKGEAVSNLQQRLQELGYFNSRVTGNFGPVTKAAVTRFQRDKRLRSDGIVDGRTQAALDNSDVSNTSLNVSGLQQRLKERGFYQGQINGKYNEQTKAAVRAAQREYGVSENDILKNEF